MRTLTTDGPKPEKPVYSKKIPDDGKFKMISVVVQIFNFLIEAT